MKEIITIQLGQAGIQMGSSCWELLSLEQNISLNGEPKSINQINLIEENGPFFYENSRGKLVPRAIFLDSEPYIINQFKSGNFKGFFNLEDLISAM